MGRGDEVGEGGMGWRGVGEWRGEVVGRDSIGRFAEVKRGGRWV